MKEKKQPKIFVLDTNVILHDFRSIHNFQENDIVIPIAVIEELDKFKKGNDATNFNAREFVREIDTCHNAVGKRQKPRQDSRSSFKRHKPKIEG